MPPGFIYSGIVITLRVLAAGWKTTPSNIVQATHSLAMPIGRASMEETTRQTIASGHACRLSGSRLASFQPQGPVFRPPPLTAGATTYSTSLVCEAVDLLPRVR